MSKTIEVIAAIVSAIIGLAIIAVIVSKNAQTPQVIQSASTGLGGLITAAVAPVMSGNQLGLTTGG